VAQDFDKTSTSRGVLGLGSDAMCPTMDPEHQWWGEYDMLETFDKQTDRDATLQVRVWMVLHFTWRDVTRRPRTVVDRIREALWSWRDKPVVPGP
jgi:hypothetical protein